MDTESINGVEVMTFAGSDAFEHWLATHHTEPGGVWLKIAKKGSGVKTLTITEALDVALCFGWIDSQRKGLDDRHYLQRYSARRATSPWSQVNVEKVEALIEAGRMQPPGQAAIDAAKADGRWDAAYVRQSEATIPDDLAIALAADDRARSAFEALDRTGQYALFLRLMKARTVARRAAELERIVEQLS